MSNKTKQIGPWLVFNVGCIECGVSSNVVGIYNTLREAKAVQSICGQQLCWREGGQNEFAIFDLSKPQADEYRDVIKTIKAGEAKMKPNYVHSAETRHMRERQGGK